MLALFLAAHNGDAFRLRLVSLLASLAFLGLSQVVGSHDAPHFPSGTFFAARKMIHA